MILYHGNRWSILYGGTLHYVSKQVDFFLDVVTNVVALDDHFLSPAIE